MVDRQLLNGRCYGHQNCRVCSRTRSHDSVIFFIFLEFIFFKLQRIYDACNKTMRENPAARQRALATGSRGDTVLGNSESDSAGQSIILRHRGRRCFWFSPFSVAVVNFGPDFIQGEH